MSRRASLRCIARSATLPLLLVVVPATGARAGDCAGKAVVSRLHAQGAGLVREFSHVVRNLQPMGQEIRISYAEVAGVPAPAGRMVYLRGLEQANVPYAALPVPDPTTVLRMIQAIKLSCN